MRADESSEVQTQRNACKRKGASMRAGKRGYEATQTGVVARSSDPADTVRWTCGGGEPVEGDW